MPESPSPELGSPTSSVTCASLRWDRQDCVPFEGWLSKDEIIVMLTPLVVPPESQRDMTSDPFEPLGRLLAQKHPSVRHVPYSKQHGITGVHVAFAKRASAVIFVVTGSPRVDEPSQLEFADIVGEACGDTPLIVVACCRIDDSELHQYQFGTVIQARGFSHPDLTEVAAVLLGEPLSPAQPSIQGPPVPSSNFSWVVQPWDYERDLADIHELWTSHVPPQFRLSQSALGHLLRRDGYAMHHVVRGPGGQLAGFCATYMTFADKYNERLVGSIAAMVVHTDLRHQKIGSILYDEALSKLSKIRGLHYLQLGSTFPRLLYGIPADHPDVGWVEARGWNIRQTTPGRGRLMADWVLRFDEGPTLNLASAGLTFRACEFGDFEQVSNMVASESERKFGFGWYDQYYQVLDSARIGDIILGFEGSTLVASAITYTYTDNNPAATDLPWAGLIAPDLGGVTCICIKGWWSDAPGNESDELADLYQMTIQRWSIGAIRF